MPDKLNSELCSKFLKGMADAGRLRIIECLCDGPQSVGAVAKKLDLPIRSTSHHLRLLRNAGLVSSTRKGKFILYSLAPEISSRRSKVSLNVLEFGCCRIELGRR
jgi:ArsR family transcriptional regulator